MEDNVKLVKEMGFDKKVSLKVRENKQKVMGKKGQLKDNKIYINDVCLERIEICNVNLEKENSELR